MTKSELMWIVGFYEGEGTTFCVQYDKRSAKGYRYFPYRLTVSIVQKDRTPLLWLQKKIGYGKLYRGINRKTGCKWSTWTVWCRQAREFLKLIYPHVKSVYKKNQIKNALKKDRRYVRPW